MGNEKLKKLGTWMLLPVKNSLKEAIRIKAHNILGQLWKLDGTTLTNKAGIWQSNDAWNLRNQDTIIYIENISKDKVFGLAYDGNDVVPQTSLQNKASQLWKKVKANDEDYFKLAYGLQFLTAKSTHELKVDKGM